MNHQVSEVMAAWERGAVVITDLNGKVLYWSGAAERDLGWTTQQAVGHGLGEYFLFAADTDIGSDMKKALASRCLQQVCQTRHSNGSQMMVALKSFPLVDGQSVPYGFLHLMCKSPKTSASPAGDSHTIDAITPDTRTRVLLHDLNNLMTGIHSILDFALAENLTGSAKSFLLEAQTTVRRGAQMIQLFRTKDGGAERVTSIIQPGPEAPKPAVTKIGSSRTSPVTEGHERILVADDESGLRMLIRAVLGYRGYQVVEAADGMEALAKYSAATEPFDLVILDIHMPRLDGLEVMRRMRAINPAARILLISGSLAGYEASNIKTAQHEHYLEKPFQNDDLVRLVRRILDQE